MKRFKRVRHRLTLPLALVLTALFVSALAATPAQAEYGPSQQVYIQVRINDSQGRSYNTGLATGWIRFDNGNSKFHLDLTLCRQNSYTPIVFRVYANGMLLGTPSGSQPAPVRPPECPTNTVSYLNQEFPFNGVQNVTLDVEGVLFDQFTAIRRNRSATYDNPFN